VRNQTDIGFCALLAKRIDSNLMLWRYVTADNAYMMARDPGGSTGAGVLTSAPQLARSSTV
jgi:hypothetical protein